MALRKFTYLDTVEGIPIEQALTDSAQFGQLTLSGISGVAINAGSASIINVPAPVNPLDAVNKQYVDSISQGLAIKPPVIAMSSTNIGALTGIPSGGIDGVTIAAGNRVLLTGQTNQAQNGIWVVNSGAWTRPLDFNTGASAAGAFTFVEEGTTYAEQGWVCTNDPGQDVVDTGNLAFVQFSGLGEVTVANGLTKTNNTIAVSLAASSGLKFDGTGKLLHQLSALSGIIIDASNNLKFQVEDTTLTIDSGLGVRVLGVPAQFTINNVATSANVTAANVSTLVGGTSSNADNLHNHYFVQGAKTVEDTATNGSVALSAGDPVCWSSTANQLVRGDAATLATGRVVGLTLAATAASGTATVVKQGLLPGVLSGATPGAPVFLAPGGGLTMTVPNATGNRIVRVGYARNATDLDVLIGNMGGRS